MINRILMELYDEYEKGNITPLLEFTRKTLPSDGTDKLFIGCVLIMFSRTWCLKPRYDCTREQLLSIVSSVKEKIGNTNLLYYYIDRVNTHKGISKYLRKVLQDNDLDKFADLIIEYLEQFKPQFIDDIKRNNKKLEKFIKRNE